MFCRAAPSFSLSDVKKIVSFGAYTASFIGADHLSQPDGTAFFAIRSRKVIAAWNTDQTGLQTM